MSYERDVRSFDERAAAYESGTLGQLHREICGRVADLVLHAAPAPYRVLDVGSGTGYLLGLLAGRRGKARTRGRATRLVTAAGLRSPRWHRVYAVIIQAVTAEK